MWKEFKEFAFKGNVVDLAVGVMIGAAFGKIVTSLVADIFTPILSLITGKMDFSTLAVKFGEGEGAASLNYGLFIQSVIDFSCSSSSSTGLGSRNRSQRSPRRASAPTA